MQETSLNRRSVIKASLSMMGIGLTTGEAVADDDQNLSEAMKRIYSNHGHPVNFEMNESSNSSRKSQNAAYDVHLHLAENETPLQMKVIPRGSSGWDQFIVFPEGQVYDVDGRYTISPPQEKIEKMRDKADRLDELAKQSMESTWEGQR